MRFNCQCDVCPRPCMGPDLGDSGGTGYAVNDLGQRICYVCCAEIDKAFMRKRGKITLYLSREAGALDRAAWEKQTDTLHGVQEWDKNRKRWKVTNWPGSLEITPLNVRKGTGRRERYDAWFAFEGFIWHGVNSGDSQLLHAKRTQERIGHGR